jgi:hypothetical protein
MVTCKPVPPALRTLPFDVATALRHGVTRRQLRHPRFRRLLAGVYVCADVPMDRARWLMAARLILPEDAVLCGVSGLHARDVQIGPPHPMRFVTRTGRPVRRPGVLVRRSRLSPPVDGGMLSAERCWVEACAELDLVDSVAAADHLVHLGHTSVPSLQTAAAALRVPGVGRARRAVAYVRSRVESVLESDTRMLLVLAGMPEPTCNLDIHGPDGFIARGDLVYDEPKVLVEYDGRQHAEDRRQWNRDIDRLEALRHAGWAYVQVTAARMHHPRAVVRRVHRELTRRGVACSPPAFGHQWVEAFEHTTFARRSRVNDHREAWR